MSSEPLKSGTSGPTRAMSHAPSNCQAKSVEIDGYEIRGEISRGGQAVVYDAVLLKTGRRVAVKVMHGGPLADEGSRMRFDREAQILAALSHPNIVTVIDRGTTTAGFQYLAMDFIQGCSLDKALWKRAHESGAPATRDELARPLVLFLKICDAVNAAHLRGIVHRDLKPSNILIDERAQPHIVDFGLARGGLRPDDGPGNRRATLNGEFLGSLPWASPEQAAGQVEKIDTRTDVYSLGVILYQILTGGRFPYQVAGSMRDVLNNIVAAQPQPPSHVLAAQEQRELTRNRKGKPRRTPELNAALDAIVLRALSKRRRDRYQTAGELAREIEFYLSGRATSASQTPEPDRILGKLKLTTALLFSVALGAGGAWLAHRTSGPAGIGSQSQPVSTTASLNPASRPARRGSDSRDVRKAPDPVRPPPIVLPATTRPNDVGATSSEESPPRVTVAAARTTVETQPVERPAPPTADQSPKSRESLAQVPGAATSRPPEAPPVSQVAPPKTPGVIVRNKGPERAPRDRALPVPVAHWTFDGPNVFDDGSGRTTALPAGPVFRVPGVHGRGLELRGNVQPPVVEADVDIMDDPKFHLKDAVTLCAWFKPLSIGALELIAGKWHRDSYALFWDDGKQVRFVVALPDGIGGWGIWKEVKAPANLGEWTHCAGVFDGHVMRLYLNGTLRASMHLGLCDDPSLVLQDSASPIQMGNHYHLLLDDVAIYDRALSERQIQLLARPPH